MRQAGVLAAAGHVALDEIPQRLPQDHANARLLAELLSDTPGLTVDPDAVATNLVFFDIGPELGAPSAFEARLDEAGVRVIGFDETGRCRAVTYHQISTDDVQRAAEIIHDCAANSGG
jgi:threonine aldolase